MADVVTVEGLDELADLLRNQTPVAAKRYLRRVTVAAANVVIDALEVTIPVAAGVLDEHLMFKKTRNADPLQVEVNIGPEKFFFWGSIQEFGAHLPNGGTVPAQHWMGRAWMACKDQCLAVFEAEASIMCDTLKDKQSDDGSDDIEESTTNV